MNLRYLPIIYSGSRENPVMKSSSAWESHPHALTQPDVNLSIHPAPTDQPQVSGRGANEQTALVVDERYALTSGMLCACSHATCCISS